MVYHNFCLTFIVLSIIPVARDNNTVFTNLIAKNWEQGDIAKEKSNGATNTSSQTIIQVLKLHFGH